MREDNERKKVREERRNRKMERGKMVKEETRKERQNKGKKEKSQDGRKK